MSQVSITANYSETTTKQVSLKGFFEVSTTANLSETAINAKVPLEADYTSVAPKDA